MWRGRPSLMAEVLTVGYMDLRHSFSKKRIQMNLKSES